MFGLDALLNIEGLYVAFIRPLGKVLVCIQASFSFPSENNIFVISGMFEGFEMCSI